MQNNDARERIAELRALCGTNAPWYASPEYRGAMPVLLDIAEAVAAFLDRCETCGGSGSMMAWKKQEPCPNCKKLRQALAKLTAAPKEGK